MTNQEQLITPPQLVEQWVNMLSSRSDYAVFSLAAQWGWDQHRAATEAELQQAKDEELEACVNYLNNYISGNKARELRAIRRPKLPSLKEQALEQLDEISTCFRISHGGPIVCDKIRQALEQLND